MSAQPTTGRRLLAARRLSPCCEPCSGGRTAEGLWGESLQKVLLEVCCPASSGIHAAAGNSALLAAGQLGGCLTPSLGRRTWRSPCGLAPRHERSLPGQGSAEAGSAVPGIAPRTPCGHRPIDPRQTPLSTCRDCAQHMFPPPGRRDKTDPVPSAVRVTCCQTGPKLCILGGTLGPAPQAGSGMEGGSESGQESRAGCPRSDGGCRGNGEPRPHLRAAAGFPEAPAQSATGL